MKTPVENFLNSIYAVTIPMLLLIVSFSIKLSALFYTAFQIPVPEFKLVASILLGITGSLCLLIISVNAKLFETNAFPIVFAVFSGVILLFAFKVIHEDVLSWPEYAKRSFLSVFLATIEYMFSKMFVRKYEEHNQNVNRKVELAALKEKFAKVQKELTRTANELTRTKEELKKVHTEFPCKHNCGAVLSSIGNKKKHEASCPKNPRNKKPNQIELTNS
ncbi:hypothetical protein [Aquimarina aggregata]|uniref:hypothetical protein n=1 Tax=Aquimarina aggregata TaxID=1642818 RepID=UPI002491E346|nr:hypothetical protein [Aquimarina aggregata]